MNDSERERIADRGGGLGALDYGSMGSEEDGQSQMGESMLFRDV